LFRVRADQFIYSRLFAFEGAYALVPKEFDGAFVSNEFPTFECKPERLLPGFIGWYFSRPAVWARLAEGGQGMGDRRKRVHPERILEHRIRLPDISVQRQLLKKLDGVAARIARIRTLQTELDALVPALVEEIFRDVVT
jgi:type I restriction enzyme S subunit